jgi:DNA-binding CsgD family transcriptional regulator
MTTSLSSPIGAGRPVTMVLAEIAHVLVPTDGIEGRLNRAMELLARIVPYEQCALVEIDLSGQPRIRLLPEPGPSEAMATRPALLRLLRLVSDGRWAGTLGDSAGSLSQDAWASYLALPLIGVDSVDGLLLVGQQVVDAYGESDLQLLTIVASQIAAYLSTCRLRSIEATLAEERLTHLAALRDSDERLRISVAEAHASRLTRRQLEVARLIAGGRSNAQIAQELVLTPGTVANHIEHILRRLSVNNRAQVAAWVVERGLLEHVGRL